ncbi:putative ribonuclease H-like domain-containing protein [Tanacetum coccineum]
MLQKKPLYDRFVKAVGMHAVPPPITGTFMPPSNDPDLDDTQVTYGSKSNNYFETNSVSNDLSLVISVTKSSDLEDTCCASVFQGNRPLSVPADSRHRPSSVPTGVDIDQIVHAGSRIDKNLICGSRMSTTVPAGRPFSADWKNHAARPMTRPTSHYFQHFSRPGYYNQLNMDEGRRGTAENPHKNRDLGIVDSGCSRSMTGNKEKLDDFVKIVGGTVTFGGGDGKITGKGTIRTSKLNFENVYYVEELQNFNLFSVSQICEVVLRVPRRHNLYCFNLTDIHSKREIKRLLTKASLDESTRRHRRMAHVNYKNMNKLAKHGLVNGLPSKLFTNEHNYVACNKGKQHKASYKAITAVITISEPL